MKILIINIDSKLPNYALAKIEKYHRDKGDEIIFDMPIYRNVVDKIYVSCVFSKNRDKCREWEDDPKVMIGGSGYDLKIVLPDEIEQVKPHLNFGFTSRGCIRNCGFCVVPKKEGKIRPVGDLMDLWDGKSKDITVLDNNILALPEHFKLICKQARENHIKVDFNQGLDYRLLTNEICHDLSTVRHPEYHFAWDNIEEEKQVLRAIHLLNKFKINRSTWYVLAGYNSTIQEDLYRLEILKENNQNAYLMRYKNTSQLTAISRWSNNHAWFHGITYKEFLNRKENKEYAKYFNESELAL